MELHEDILRATMKLPLTQMLQDLKGGSKHDFLASPLKYVTSIWEEYLMISGERVIAHRIFVNCENSGRLGRVGWLLEEGMTQCVQCSASFGIFNSRSHCRTCGNLICQKCKRQGYIEELEAHGPATVCSQCCWGQECVPIVTYTPTGGALPLVIRDLYSSADYQQERVAPRYVLATSLTTVDKAGFKVPVYINLCTSTAVPLRSTGFAAFCGAWRPCKDASALVFDIVLHPALLSRSLGEFDDLVHEQVINFLQRLYHIKTSFERNVLHRLIYFEPNKTIEENSARTALRQSVHFPIPPQDIFAKYIQVPLLDEDKDPVMMVADPEQDAPAAAVNAVRTVDMPALIKAANNSTTSTITYQSLKSPLSSDSISSDDKTVKSTSVKKQPIVIIQNEGDGRAMLTRDMVVIDHNKSLDSKEAEELKVAAKKMRSLLLGWQVLVRSADDKEMKGCYVVTGERKQNGKQLYRLSNFEEQDQWVQLSKKKNSKGFIYQPQRKVL